MKFIKHYLTISIAIALSMALAALVTGCSLPTPTAYPEWDFNKIVDDTKQISDDLDAYIRDFLDGNAGGNIPRSLMPYGPDPNVWALDGFYIVKGTDATNFSKRQFVYAPEYMHDPNRPGWVTDPNRLGGAFRTGQSTYVCQWSLWIPFEHKLKITGKFPHCRFFDIQVGPPFEPYVYHFKGYTGSLETPIVDVDIEPDNGSVNPFRIGQNRNATNRNYSVTYIMKSGRYIDFDPNYCPRAPYYRGSGNTRYGSGIQYQGPWADPNFNFFDAIVGYGRWDFTQIWMRYYSPDKAHAPYAGAFDPNNNSNSPRLVFYTPQDEPYYIYGDDSKMMQLVASRTPIPITDPADPAWTALNDYTSEGHGTSWWYGVGKMCDIGYTGYGGMVRSALDNGIGSLPSPYTDWKVYTRDCIKGFSGKGESQPNIGSWEASTSCVNYYSIISQTAMTGSDKVSVLTGKLPTFNPTRNGETSNVAAQCRMWIFDLYSDVMDFETNSQLGLNQQCLIDDEVVIDANRRYVIVMSTTENRPSNAYSQNGVTWLDNFGNKSGINWRLRWVSVYPDWYMSPTLHESPLGFKSIEHSSDFDPNWIGYNRHDRYMGWYLPKRHYMTKAEFERLESPINPAMVHTWRADPDDQYSWVQPYGWTQAYETTSGTGGTQIINLTNTSGRYVMLDMNDHGSGWGYGTYTIFEMRVKDADGNNLALNKPARASSEYDWYGMYNWPYAFDGDAVNTCWASYGNRYRAWLYVDLGSTKNIATVEIVWKPSSSEYAKHVRVLTANELY